VASTVKRRRCVVAGRDIHSLAESERGRLRNQRSVSCIKFHHLLPEFSALENVAMPLLVRRMKVAARVPRRSGCSKRVGLRRAGLQHRPHQLSAASGSARGRARSGDAAAYRAAMSRLGNLDGGNADSVLALMLELNRERGNQPGGGGLMT